MDRERQLYDKFVDVLNEKLDDAEIKPKELEIIMNFLKNQNIQATTNHEGLNRLNEKLNLPFDEDSELPLKRVK